MLEHGADPEILDDKQTSPLIIAAFNGHYDIVSMLLKHGVDTSLIFRGFTAKGWANSRGHKNIVTLFEEYEKNRNRT